MENITKMIFGSIGIALLIAILFWTPDVEAIGKFIHSIIYG